MLVNPKEILQDAEKNNYAILGVNTTTFEGIRAAIEAAEEVGAPVMLSHAQSHEKVAPIDEIGPLMVENAIRAKVPCIVHLDHGSTYEYAIRAIRNGFTSIMYDCAHMSLEDNIRHVAEFTKLAHSMGVIVEGEVGNMPSNIVGQGGCTEFGVGVENIEQYYTIPEDAKKFVDETGVDMLTISFGTVHGIFVDVPKLDIALLEKIHAVADASLVVHGTSGVDADQLIAAINGGIRKMNFYTNVGTAPVGPIEKAIAETEIPLYFHDLAYIARQVMKEQTKKQIELLQNR